MRAPPWQVWTARLRQGLGAPVAHYCLVVDGKGGTGLAFLDFADEQGARLRSWSLVLLEATRPHSAAAVGGSDAR